MNKPSVFVTRPLPLAALELLKERCEVEMNPENRTLSKDELLAKIQGRDAVLVVSTPLDEDVFKAVKGHCKIFANYGAGYNNIDVDAATKHGMLVSNTPDAVTDATADLTWALLLSTARRIAECNAFVRSGQKGWGVMNMIGTQVSGKTLGIIGGGRIGTAVAERGKGFKMKIIYTDVKPSPSFEAATGGTYVDKDMLLKEADFISLHVPLLPGTRHLMSTKEFTAMKETGILINASRGPIVDEKALVQALLNGSIGGAGLDVFEQEPPNMADGFDKLANVVLTPHIGTATMHARIEMGKACTHNIFAALDGLMPPNCLNPQAKGN